MNEYKIPVNGVGILSCRIIDNKNKETYLEVQLSSTNKSLSDVKVSIPISAEQYNLLAGSLADRKEELARLNFEGNLELKVKVEGVCIN